MLLSNAGEYGIRAMLHLAYTKKNCKITEISKTWGIPDSFLRKILIQLSKAGLIASSRGVNGGYYLAKTADKITVLDIVEAIEGKIVLNKCLLDSELCEYESWCPVHDVWEETQAAYKNTLKSKTLENLISDPKFREGFNKKTGYNKTGYSRTDTI